ncbi:transporter substrate-binding domain-containing protein [Streptomyces sp. NPDC050485]|uniref:transporter substrate-binding domain-containing protein n=1 Tax=Streptomyces sp. NPDC050485 TaxID=3365617 RepID=UPI0037B92AFC
MGSVGSLGAPSDTLAKIRDTGYIQIGHREGLFPLGYYDQMGQPVGYAIDLALRVVEAAKAELGIPELKVRYVPATPQNRVQLVQKGMVDLEAGLTAHTIERAQHVDFSTTALLSDVRLLTRVDSPVSDWSELKGTAVVTTAGTMGESEARSLNDKQGLGMTIIAAKDAPGAFQMLEGGRVVACIGRDAVLAGMALRARQPQSWRVVGTPRARGAMALSMRKRDDQFGMLVNRTIADLQLSGEAEKLYNKWFASPLPPKGRSLDLPLSDEMRKLYAEPNSTPLT